MQVLRDPVRREAYDQQMALQQMQYRVAIAADVHLEDMQEIADGPAHKHFMYPCRCGGAYLFDSSDLSLYADSLITQCDTCSLYIKVHITNMDSQGPL